MSALVGALLVLAAALAVALGYERRVRGRLAARLVGAGRRLDPDVAPSVALRPDRAGRLAGASSVALGDAVSVVERAVERAVVRGSAESRAEVRLARALSAVPQGIVIFDEAMSAVFRNPAASAYLSARHGDALVEEAIGELAAAALRGAPGTRALELFGPPRRTVSLDAVPLELDPEAPGALVIVDDITERRRLEAVRRDFVANISHELKTPVGALSLLAETLLAEDDAEVTRRLAARMLTEADRVGHTIDDLLELSRIEAEEQPLREAVAVSEVMAEAVGRIAPAAEQRRIGIDTDPPSGRLTVLGDRRQLVSAVYNLLENAVKYSEDGSRVALAARTDGRFVDIAVIDHGVGIPRRDLERVFERFYRVDRARSRDSGGTGLGLSIVRHVAGNHQGEVRAESQEGQGSTFTLRLPVAPGPVAVRDQAG